MIRVGSLAATAFAVGAIVGPTLRPPVKSLIWNASASVPIGLYAMQPPGIPVIADLLAVRPPPALAAYLAVRGYLPQGVPLLKRVAALSGHIVCRRGLTILVDGTELGRARKDDGMGRPLPTWQGCRTVGPGQIFLMNWQSPDSFDGRYFGPLPRSTIIARAIPLWTDEAGDDGFVWRAAMQ